MEREGVSPTARQLLEHEDWLRTLAFHLVREKEAASDLFQETVEAAIRSRRPDQFSMRPWLFGIMRNLSRMGSRLERRRYRREAKAQRDQAADAPPEIDSPEVAVDVLRTRRLLVDVVRSLREPYQQTILLRYYEGLSAADIARKTGLPPATVRSHLKRGLHEIRARLDRDAGGDRRRWYALLAPLLPLMTADPGRDSAGGGRWSGRALSMGALTLVVVSAGMLRVSSCALHRGEDEGSLRSNAQPGLPLGAGRLAAVPVRGTGQAAHAEQDAGATVYLSPTGDDRNPGTSPDVAWKTFSHAIPRLGPGDTLILTDGTYDRGGTGLPQIDCATTARRGTEGRPIVIKAAHDRKALVADDGSVTLFRVRNCAFWTIEGLRLEHGDHAGSDGTLSLWISDSHHIVLRRLLGRQPNRFNNEAVVELGSTSDSLVEDSELYDFHVDGVRMWKGARNVVRRIYCNSRMRDGGIGGGHSGDACVRASGEVDDVIENVLSENNESLIFGTQLRRTRVLGSISRADHFGFLMSAMEGGEDPRTHDSEIAQSIAVQPREVGVYARRAQNLRLRNVTVLDSGAQGLAADCHGDNQMVSAVFVENSLVLGTRQRAASFEKAPCLESALESSALHASRDDLPGARAIGPCTVYLPPDSGLRGKGKEGADIGAEIIYRYENGSLTGSPLWSPAGAGPEKYRFTACGTVVEGVNSDPATSCIGVHQRLFVGAANGCALPY